MCGLVNGIGGRSKSIKLPGGWVVMSLKREKVLTNSLLLFFWFWICWEIRPVHVLAVAGSGGNTTQVCSAGWRDHGS